MTDPSTDTEENPILTSGAHTTSTLSDCPPPRTVPLLLKVYTLGVVRRVYLLRVPPNFLLLALWQVGVELYSEHVKPVLVAA